MDVNFDKYTIILHFLIISFMLAKFQKDKKSVVISQSDKLDCIILGLVKMRFMGISYPKTAVKKVRFEEMSY